MLSIEATDLTKSFGALTAVRALNLEVNSGEIFGLVGPDASGKTTTLRMLCGILPPDDGGARVAGCDIRSETELLREKIGYLPQRFGLYGDLTVLENLRFFGGIYGLSGAFQRQREEQVLGRVGLGELRDRITRALAVGWKQRLALGCSILHEPSILFLDEPTSGT